MTATTDALDGLGSGLGGLIGGIGASGAIGSGLGAVTGLLGAGAGAVAPYNVNGVAQIPTINSLQGTSNIIGTGRVTNDNPLDFQSFAKNFNMSEGAKYLMNTAETAQDNSAASKGGFYSGANDRAHTAIAEGIANQDLLSQYQAMLTGQQQNTTQEQSAYNNLFNQETLGEKAGTTQSVLAGAGSGAISSLYQQDAKAQQSKGSGIGDLLGTGLKWLSTLG